MNSSSGTGLADLSPSAIINRTLGGGVRNTTPPKRNSMRSGYAVPFIDVGYGDTALASLEHRNPSKQSYPESPNNPSSKADTSYVSWQEGLLRRRGSEGNTGSKDYSQYSSTRRSSSQPHGGSLDETPKYPSTRRPSLQHGVYESPKNLYLASRLGSKEYSHHDESPQYTPSSRRGSKQLTIDEMPIKPSTPTNFWELSKLDASHHRAELKKRLDEATSTKERIEIRKLLSTLDDRVEDRVMGA
jgi:hypothetical protein